IDFCKRLANGAVNKKCVESLIKCGAFDSFDINRRQLLSSYETILESIAKEKRNNIDGQVSLFDPGNGARNDFSYEFPDIEDFERQRLLNMEKELLGIYVTGNPLDEYEDIILQKATFFSSQTKIDENTNQNQFYDGRGVTCAGLVRQITKKVTKNNNMMAFVELEDIYGSMELVVFPNVLEKYSALIIDDAKIVVKGKLSLREDEDIKVICDEVHPLKNGIDRGMQHDKVRAEQLDIRTPGMGKADKIYINADKADMERFYAFVKYFGGYGKTEIIVRKTENGVKFQKKLGSMYNLDADDELVSELAEALGADNIYIKH
ncbi:MAG: OB-fold nucleic acid binding domain-containing protein, partial [Clostridia bacterium]|nr:OB-fold nucleic acid binding domain-containing protein [Clostridia bacterium]